MSCLVLQYGVGQAEHFCCRVVAADRNLVLLFDEGGVLLPRVAEHVIDENSLGLAARTCRGFARP